MNNFARLFFLLFLLPSSVFAYEAYDLIDALVPSDGLPRVLNSEDLNLQPTDPQPLFTPNGDFNGDGEMDMAISGIYGLPPKKNTHFLLVGTQRKNPIRYESLFFKEYAGSIFLHKPGTTGDKDPGDQAFSITFCSECSDGIDFYWNGKKQTFDQHPWVRTFRHYQSYPHIPELDLVPEETVDKALKIVGDLNDVKIFVAGLKKEKRELGTRVKPETPAAQPEGPTNVIVQIFEKRKNKELLYDEIIVDVKAEKIIDRKRKKK